MICNMYAMQNIHSGLYDGILLYKTDKQASFEASRKVPAYAQEYTELIRVGQFDNETGEVIPLKPDEQIVLPWMEVPTVDNMAVKTPISHEPPEVQHTKFQEKIT